jgi:hypothetical protein
MTGPEDETYRAAMRVDTPEHGPATLLILRRGLGRSARTWLVFEGAIRATAVLPDPQIGELTAHLHATEGRQQ